MVEARTLTIQGHTWLTGVFVRPAATNAENLNRFSQAKLGLAHILMLLAMMAAIAVTLGALLRIWRTKLFKRRWLWTIGALVGLATLRMNWSTGAFYFQPLFVQLLSVGAVKSPVFAPWVLSVSVPAVALVALLRRERVVEDDVSPEADAA